MNKVMKHITNLDELTDYFHILGKLHHQNGITIPELLPFGPVFLTCSVHYFPLSQRSNIDVTNSWIRLFLYMNEMMRGGYPNIEYELNKEEKAIISQGFGVLKRTLAPSPNNSQNVCLESEFKSFALSKIYLPIFRIVVVKTEPISEELIVKHWEMINGVVEKFISTMNDPPKMETTFVELGSIHNKIGIRKNFIEVMGVLYIKTIRLVLHEKSEWNSEICSAWYHLFRVIIFQMKLGYSKEWKHDDNEESRSTVECSRSHSSVATSILGSPVNNNHGHIRSRSVTPSSSSQLTIHHARRISMEEIISSSFVDSYRKHPNTSLFGLNNNTLNVVSRSAHDISGSENIPSIKLLPSNSVDKSSKNAEEDSPSTSLIAKNRRQSYVSLPKSNLCSIFPGQPSHFYQSCSSLGTMERRRQSHQDHVSSSSLLTIPSPGSQRPRSKSDAARTLNYILNGFVSSKSTE
ncbi:uncharacterized protein [Lepeophtheirus salmonis]|nr:uncharacterized protein LOC121122100 [Lepeophtheirus salmonis]